MRPQKWVFCLKLLGSTAYLISVCSFAASPEPQTAVGEKNQPAALSAAKEELLGELSAELKPINGTYLDRFANLDRNEFDLSPDGRRFAVMVKMEKNKWVAVIDGKAGPEFEEVRDKIQGRSQGVGRVLFSPDSQHATYAAHSGENKWVRIFDGNQGPEFQEVWAPLFSPDSQHFAYGWDKFRRRAAQPDADTHGKVVNQEPLKECAVGHWGAYRIPWRPAFSSHPKRRCCSFGWDATKCVVGWWRCFSLECTYRVDYNPHNSPVSFDLLRWAPGVLGYSATSCAGLVTLDVYYRGPVSLIPCRPSANCVKNGRVARVACRGYRRSDEQ